MEITRFNNQRRLIPELGRLEGRVGERRFDKREGRMIDRLAAHAHSIDDPRCAFSSLIP